MMLDLHPIEDAYFHQSHLKEKQDYGHQAVAVMLSCNGIILNYAFVLYNKSISKIDIVQNIAKELPEPLVMSFSFVNSGMFLKNNLYICTEGVPYHWNFNNKPPAVLVRNEKRSSVNLLLNYR